MERGLLRMTLEIYKNPEVEFPPGLAELLHKYQNRVLADDSLADVDVLLLSMYLIENVREKTGADYVDCKDLFISLGREEDNFRKVVYNAKKGSLIKERDRMLYFLVKGLKRVKERFSLAEKTSIYIMKSGENFTATRIFEEFLSTEIQGEEILLCDPYVSPSTLFPFSVLKEKIKSMKILTSNVFEKEKFEEYRKKMKKETGISVEVQTSKKIHDRYLICGSKCWYIGSSVKDLGNKDATMREISEVITSMKDLFLKRWNESS